MIGVVLVEPASPKLLGLRVLELRLPRLTVAKPVWR